MSNTKQCGKCFGLGWIDGHNCPACDGLGREVDELDQMLIPALHQISAGAEMSEMMAQRFEDGC